MGFCYRAGFEANRFATGRVACYRAGGLLPGGLGRKSVQGVPRASCYMCPSSNLHNFSPALQIWSHHLFVFSCSFLAFPALGVPARCHTAARSFPPNPPQNVCKKTTGPAGCRPFRTHAPAPAAAAACAACGQACKCGGPAGVATLAPRKRTCIAPARHCFIKNGPCKQPLFASFPLHSAAPKTRGGVLAKWVK